MTKASRIRRTVVKGKIKSWTGVRSCREMRVKSYHLTGSVMGSD